MTRPWIRILRWTLDVIFPIRCLGCADFRKGYICRGCLSGIPIFKKFECIGCKSPVELGGVCPRCCKDYAIDRLFISADLKIPLVEKALKAFKYKFIWDLSSPLSGLIRRYIKWLLAKKKFNIIEANPIVVPVPLHRRRQNRRGFNQSELLSRRLAGDFQLEYATAIKRIKTSKPQADVKRREDRLQNVAGLFVFIEVKPQCSIQGRTILLIDDICTTGATLNECAKVLKQKGAHEVWALAVARG